MASKFLFVIAGVIAVMVVLVALPRVNIDPALQQELTIDYSRQNLTRLDDGRLVAAIAEDMSVKNDGSATFRNITVSSEKTFRIKSEEMNSLKSLIITTGFAQVPSAHYPEKDGLDEFTKYTLKLTSGNESKTITWVSYQASSTAVPSIVRNIGDQLDTIIKNYT